MTSNPRTLVSSRVVRSLPLSPLSAFTARAKPLLMSSFGTIFMILLSFFKSLRSTTIKAATDVLFRFFSSTISVVQEESHSIEYPFSAPSTNNESNRFPLIGAFITRNE